ncbi:MAG TPA: ROK family protein [Thermoplasmata archaeon]|nr:ROK family protein [Thermoplasmata archaeon]
MESKNFVQHPPKRGEKRKFAVGLDVGGTSLKSAIVSSDGAILNNSFKKRPFNSQGSAESIIETFFQTSNLYRKMAERLGIEIAGIGIGMPGPFDYEKGVCLIPPRLHKFGKLYGLNLKQKLEDRLKLKEIRFENDAWTFLRGDAWIGKARGCNRAIGVTLGTGVGSAFMAGNQILLKGNGVPPLGWIGGMPYENGIAEDKISQRWVLARYKELSKQKGSVSVEEIARRGKQLQDRASLETFKEMGQRLGKILKPIASNFKADCIVFGGQISKSFFLFSDPIKTELQLVPSLKKIAPANSIDLSPIYGAAKLIFLGSGYKPQKLVFEEGFQKGQEF